MYNRLVHNYSKFLAGAALLLIVAGGLVTSTGSGLSVPDWPLSYGQLFPPMVGGVRFEHSHRLIAAGVGLLTLVLAILLFKKEGRGWVRWLGALAVLGVALQAILGGLTVIYLLPPAVSVSHACLAQSFFCLLALIALFTSREWLETPPIASENARSLKNLLIVTVIFIYLQLVAGSVVRHGGTGFIGYHLVLAFLIALHVTLILVKILRDPNLRALARHIGLLTVLVLCQLFLGMGAYVSKFLASDSSPKAWDTLITTAHQSAGALILAGAVLLLGRLLRLTKKA